jgi:DoxX-like protein
MSIYVEIRIRGDIDELWRRTQDPGLHERWDLRFSEIVYLPRPDETVPQRFSYATRIGLGLGIRGEGESEGSRVGIGGERVSALKFWSRDRKSLILEGSGYWRYVPTPDGIRFLTWYSYRTRFGLPGRLVDAALFGPIMGWATAWSFDRLRLWIEQGIDPAVSGQRAVIHAVARLGIALVFLYHGLVPKLLYPDATELAMLLAAGVPASVGDRALIGIGLGEVAFGAGLLVAWRARWPLLATAALMVGAIAGVAYSSPGMLRAAFNPVTLNLSVAALAAIGWLTARELPSAARCLRERPGGEA